MIIDPNEKINIRKAAAVRLLIVFTLEFRAPKIPFLSMPSRAVVRKKARREVKKKKTVDIKSSLGICQSLSTVAGKPALVSSISVVSDGWKESTPLSLCATSASSSHPSNLARKREREVADESSFSVNLSRKERHRLRLESRLEKEIIRLDAQRKREELKIRKNIVKDSNEADPTNSAPLQSESPLCMDDDEKLSPSPSSMSSVMRVRHDQKFVNGTFWRDRKERRARTVFLGGLPLKNFGPSHVEKMIISTLRSNPDAQTHLKTLGVDTSPLSTIDYLQVKPGGKVRNMYVTLASVPLAECLISSLDRKEFNGRLLRCNFAADKTERAEAIKKRGNVCRTRRG